MDPIAPLLLRSKALERRGLSYEAVDDAEKAVESKKNRKVSSE